MRQNNFLKVFAETFDVVKDSLTPEKNNNPFIYALRLIVTFFLWLGLGVAMPIIGLIVNPLLFTFGFVITLWEMIRYYFDYKRHKKYVVYRAKVISETMELLEMKLKSQQALKFQVENSEINSFSLNGFLRSFFTKYNIEYNTVNLDNSLQCHVNRRRSLGDIYLITKYYFPNITLKELIKELLWIQKNFGINSQYCSDVRKHVFYSNSKSDYNSPMSRTEYGVIKDIKGDTRYICWLDIKEHYGS